MELRGNWQNIDSKEAFLYYLIKTSHGSLYPKKRNGEITSSEYWDLFNDLVVMAKEFCDFDYQAFHQQLQQRQTEARSIRGETSFSSDIKSLPKGGE